MRRRRAEGGGSRIRPGHNVRVDDLLRELSRVVLVDRTLTDVLTDVTRIAARGIPGAEAVVDHADPRREGVHRRPPRRDGAGRRRAAVRARLRPLHGRRPRRRAAAGRRHGDRGALAGLRRPRRADDAGPQLPVGPAALPGLVHRRPEQLLDRSPRRSPPPSPCRPAWRSPRSSRSRSPTPTRTGSSASRPATCAWRWSRGRSSSRPRAC